MARTATPKRTRGRGADTPALGVGGTLDLTGDLRAAAELGARAELVDDLLADSLEVFGRLVPYDLATVMELQGEELQVRVARGARADSQVRDHRLDLQHFPSIREVLDAGRARAFEEHEHAGEEGDPFDGVLDFPHGHACMVVPLSVQGDHLGVMTFDRERCERYPDATVQLADVFGKLLAVAMKHGAQTTLLRRMLAQVEEQARVLTERVGGATSACELVEASASPLMVQLTAMARQVAATDTPVLLTGETGSGKEVLANAIHGYSPRARRPMVSINCAALPENLIESELFGHVKGAFSGATASRIGRFQAANGGTLFLDEVGELPVELQAKLLRVLQEGTFEPVGSDRTVRVDVRILAATNRDLQAAVGRGEFREDLYYRLAVFPLHIPPLRARREDIVPIAEGFLASLARRRGGGPWTLGEGAGRWLEGREWRGNVRELVNVLERATILRRAGELTVGDLAGDPGAPGAPAVSAPSVTEDPGGFPTLEEAERRHVLEALRRTGGKVYGKAGAAALLGLPGSTLQSRMKRLGLGGARDHRPPRG